MDFKKSKLQSAKLAEIELNIKKRKKEWNEGKRDLLWDLVNECVRNLELLKLETNRNFDFLFKENIIVFFPSGPSGIKTNTEFIRSQNRNAFNVKDIAFHGAALSFEFNFFGKVDIYMSLPYLDGLSDDDNVMFIYPTDPVLIRVIEPGQISPAVIDEVFAAFLEKLSVWYNQ